MTLDDIYTIQTISFIWIEQATENANTTSRPGALPLYLAEGSAPYRSHRLTLRDRHQAPNY